MENISSWARKNRELTILIVVGVVIAAGVGIANVNSQPSQLEAAQVKLQQDEAKLVSSALNGYYVDNGTYPADIGTIENNSANARSAVKDLDQFDYRVSGDRKSYQFTYQNKSGSTQTVKGNYDKDLH